jgi:hypothetical protein
VWSCFHNHEPFLPVVVRNILVIWALKVNGYLDSGSNPAVERGLLGHDSWKAELRKVRLNVYMHISVWSVVVDQRAIPTLISHDSNSSGSQSGLHSHG